jgi:hypothetical protein
LEGGEGVYGAHDLESLWPQKLRRDREEVLIVRHQEPGARGCGTREPVAPHPAPRIRKTWPPS